MKNITLIDWDEGVFAIQAEWIASSGYEGKPFNFQTPPLFQILIAILFKVIGYKDWILPLLSIIFSGLTIYIIFIFGSKLYNEKIGLIAALVFISTEYFLFFSKSGLSDAVFLFFFITALYYFYLSILNDNKYHYLLCGIFTVLACYTKYTGPILFLIYIIIGLIQKKFKNKYFYLFTILLPIILILPYFLVFIKLITTKGIIQRHTKLLGINHLKFLYYLLRFAPTVFLAALFHRIKEKNDYFILSVIIIFFVVLGFYYPYLRLAYPLIPLFSYFAACFIYKLKKVRSYLAGLVILINILIGYDTIIYHSRVPAIIREKIDKYSNQYGIDYVITATPPNILFYIPGNIMASDEHLVGLGRNKFVNRDKRVKISKDHNLLIEQNHILYLSSNIFPEINKKLEIYKAKALLKETIEFTDAPVYYKDLFNELRTKKQIYEIFVIETAKLDTADYDYLWQISFQPGVTVIKK